MDILKKMFEGNQNGSGAGGGGTGQPGDNNNRHPEMPKFGNEFRKPVWFDDCESDDELYGGNSSRKAFGFQVFTNPLEMQKHFEQQVDEMMRALHQFEGNDDALFNDNARENYLKPGFEQLFGKDAAAAEADTGAAAGIASSLDTDLDGEIYADQLHSLLQRISPDLDAFWPPSAGKTGAKVPRAANGGVMSGNVGTIIKPLPLTDEQLVWNLFHGTATAAPSSAIGRKSTMPSRGSSSGGAGGIFEGAFQGPKIFRQSIMTQTTRRPDGTTETRRVVRDADGTTNTIVTRTTADGRTETTASSSMSPAEANKNAAGIGGKHPPSPPGGLPPPPNGAVAGVDGVGGVLAQMDRNVYVTKAGYAMPLNIW